MNVTILIDLKMTCDRGRKAARQEFVSGPPSPPSLLQFFLLGGGGGGPDRRLCVCGLMAGVQGLPAMGALLLFSAVVNYV